MFGTGSTHSMLDEICIKRRAGRKFDPGSVLAGRWTIVSSLSHQGGDISDGCFNRGIKLVTDARDQRSYVLKMLTPDICLPGHAARELRILQHLTRCAGEDPTNLVRLYAMEDGARHPHDIPWIMTEHCDAGTLAHMMTMCEDEQVNFPEPFLWHVFQSLAQAARFCHSNGVVHRDITLTNVFVQNAQANDIYPSIKLADFGCAVTRDDLETLSIGELFPGNPRYMPPEGCEANPSCDIYQLGLVMLCMFMREAEPTEALADFYSNQGCQTYSPELRNLIHWCLSKNAKDRPSADVLVRKIEESRSQMAQYKGQMSFEDLLKRERKGSLDSVASDVTD